MKRSEHLRNWPVLTVCTSYTAASGLFLLVFEAVGTPQPSKVQIIVVRVAGWFMHWTLPPKTGIFVLFLTNNQERFVF